MTTAAKETPGKLAQTLKDALLPIMLFALVATPLCWGGAFIFRDRIDWSNALIGLGALPIVIAICAYLYVLLKTVKRAD